MAELKTQPTDVDVDTFIDSVENETRRDDCRAIVKLMRKITKLKPRMWGTSIIGFGDYHYKYASGREGDWFQIGCSPRKQDLTLYLMCGIPNVKPLLAKLGKHKTGKSCLYIKRLTDIDMKILEHLIRESFEAIKSGQINYS